jgi:hypothetical protein
MRIVHPPPRPHTWVRDTGMYPSVLEPASPPRHLLLPASHRPHAERSSESPKTQSSAGFGQPC